MALPCRRKEQTDQRYGHQDRHHTKCDKHTRMCLHGTNTMASTQDDHLQCLKSCVITGWPSTKDELYVNLKPYWLYRDELAVIDGIVLKDRHIGIPNSLRQQVLDQLHTNHMGIKKTKLLACKSIY